MSAIMLVMGKQFAVLCGETMFCLDSGKKSKISKVKMVEDKFLYGFTGRNTSAVDFFRGLIDNKLNPTDELCNLTYPQLIDILNKQFLFYQASGVTDNFDVYAIVCGAANRSLQCTRYLLRPNEYSQQVTESANSFKIVGSLLEKHLENLNINYQSKDIVLEIINAFQQMMDKGIEFDYSINNEVEAYLMNRGIDRPYITQRLK